MFAIGTVVVAVFAVVVVVVVVAVVAIVVTLSKSVFWLLLEEVLMIMQFLFLF